MSKRLTITVVLLAALILSFGVVGITAYSSMTVDRSASVDVVSDAEGVVQLNPGGSSFVELDGGDELSMDVTKGGANGVNVEAVLLVGDDASPTSSYAFSVVNNDNVERSMSFSYALNDTSGVSGDPVEFRVYDSAGSQVGSFSDSSSLTSTFSSGEEQYVVVEVDTRGLSSTEDLSGQVSIVSE